METYLLDYLRERPEADTTPWLSAEVFARVRPLLAASEDGRLKPIYDALDGAVSYLQLRLAKRAFERDALAASRPQPAANPPD